ncbi:microtubule-destabilizing protein 60 isoform X2 [Elaeis guineensis]|uniref:Protein TPX2 isoform X2 n=1 Tax=Elaeis guineensis var. tenera TaxID=51953 RepID=A0A6I9RAV8_ELAGV|nr:protein TPX2 isoform X2 [Elaeis guineensis]
MEDPSMLTSPKSSKIAPPSSNTKRGVKNSQPQPFRLQTEQRGQIKEQALAKRVQELVAEEAKLRIHVAQGLPLTTDKPQNLPKPHVKEQTKPLNIKLHTEQRAARRAGFNNLVSSKNYSLEILRRFEEKLLKVIEEEEIRIMRKEMVPKAQLMPIFDRPFFPQRSTRPLTVPREPSFHFLKQKRCSSGEPYKIHQHVNQSMKAVK